jgi:RNA polymerase sigma-70 factor (ECF subfamily)
MGLVTATLPPTSRSDEALLELASTGDRSALDELFRRYRMPAYRVAHRLLGNEADALDAVQDGFVKVLTNIGRFEQRSSFKTWLLRIVSNAALDLGRQRGRRDSLAAGGESLNGESLALSWEDPNLGLESAELRRLLDAALATLPETQRQTFVLHVDAEMSYRDIADALGISIGTVMSRLYYARQKLRNYLAPHMRP